jgi:predicted Na+-dependent transporter
MSERQKRAEHIKTHASKSLRVNLRILSVVYTVLLLITVYDLFISGALFSQVVIALIIGLIAGLVSTRMFKISWDKDKAQVVGRIDRFGVIVLVLFVLFELNRSRIAGLFSSGEALGSIGLVLIIGTLFGRILGISKKILRVLSDEEVI